MAQLPFWTVTGRILPRVGSVAPPWRSLSPPRPDRRVPTGVGTRNAYLRGALEWTPLAVAKVLAVRAVHCRSCRCLAGPWGESMTCSTALIEGWIPVINAGRSADPMGGGRSGRPLTVRSQPRPEPLHRYQAGPREGVNVRVGRSIAYPTETVSERPFPLEVRSGIGFSKQDSRFHGNIEYDLPAGLLSRTDVVLEPFPFREARVSVPV